MARILTLLFAPVLILPQSHRFRVICWEDAFAVSRGNHIEVPNLSYQAALETADRLNRGN